MNKTKIKWALWAATALLAVAFVYNGYLVLSNPNRMRRVVNFFGYGVVPASSLTTFNVSELGEYGIQAKRGEILAADGSVLARAVKRYDVRIDPKIAREYNVAFNRASIENICQRLNLTPAELLDFCASEKSRYLLVRSNVEESVVNWFCSDEGRRLAKGFMVETVQRREYPLGRNAAHVTGCIYRPIAGNATVGCNGVEYTCNSILAGKGVDLARDVGQEEREGCAKPVHGGSVTTTIVPSIQNTLADILSKAVSSNCAETAWGIVMDARTGGIVAMVSLPSYDPGSSRDVKNASSYFFNNAVMGMFEPGGVMKPLTYAMALDKKAVSVDTKIDHEDGVFEYYGSKLYDVPGATGVLSVAEAFVKRTEIGAAKTGLMIWKDEYPEGLKKFGFGRKIGNGTVYGEAVGILRPAKHIDPVTFSRLGLGRGLAVTGLQLASAYATLANGGKTASPHLVEKTVSINGCETLFRGDPPVQVVSESSAKFVSSLMKDAMMAAAKEFSVDFSGVEIAGMIAEAPIPEKGKYSKTDFNSLAAAFFPAESPKWVVAIGFSRSKPEYSAGRIALPALAEIARTISER